MRTSICVLSFILAGALITLAANTASAASCPKTDQEYFDKKIAEFSVCVQKGALRTPGFKTFSDDQMKAAFDAQQPCKQSYNEVMGYIAKMKACKDGKPMDPQLLVRTSESLKKSIYNVIINGIRKQQ